MKAWVLHNISDIRLEDVEEPVLQEGEVLVQVKAVGICVYFFYSALVINKSLE